MLSALTFPATTSSVTRWLSWRSVAEDVGTQAGGAEDGHRLDGVAFNTTGKDERWFQIRVEAVARQLLPGERPGSREPSPSTGADRMRLRPLLPIALVTAVLLLPLLVALYLTQPVPRSSRPSVPPAEVSAERLEAHVRALSERFTPRDFTRPDNLERAAAYIRGELARTTDAVREQPFQAGGATYRNVIGSFGPEEGERIVVGAHYDAAGPYPAADDNASGVAGLLELARLLRAAPPAVRVDLVAYPLEEPPFFRTPHMGSALHARSLREAGVAVRAMISLEMIGYFTDAPASQRYPVGAMGLLYPATGDFIAVVGKVGQGGLVRRVKGAMRGASPLGVESINAPRWVPGVDFSDHSSYWDAGYPAVMITDTAFYRNPFYHTGGDTAETLDYARMAMVVRGVYAAVKRLA